MTTGIVNAVPAPLSDLIDLSGNRRTCSLPPNFPRSSTGSSSLLTADGRPLVCGGGSRLIDCQVYRPDTEQWEDGPDMLENRIYSPTAELPGGGYWVANAANYDDGYGNSEIYL